jgi:CBS domain containing-hemolysin-like protein
VTTAWVLLGVAALLIAGNAVFVAAETGLVTIDRNEVESRERQGDVRFVRVAGTLRRLSTYLSGAQLGITVTSLAIGLVAEPSLATLLEGPLEYIGVGADAAEVTSVAVALLVATAVQMVFGELVPKNIALSRPMATVTWVVLPLIVFTRVARPVIAVLNGAANRLLRAGGVEPVEELRSARTPDELASVVRRAGDQGALADDTATLMERSLSFSGKTAADVMTPRTRMRTVQSLDPVASVIQATRVSGHSRFPVVGNNVDDVRGLIHVKDVIAVPASERGSTQVRQVMTEPVVVPISLRLDPLLQRLQQRSLQLAVVVDEYGGTAGIVTFEDLVEELVGDVVDEHDTSASGIRQHSDTAWVLSGLLRPDEVEAATGVHMPEGHADYETVAGLVVARLGRLAEVGDEVQVSGMILTVERLDGRRIDRIRLTTGADHDGDDHASSNQWDV